MVGGSMLDLLDVAGLMPHGMCYAWRPDLVFMHVASDVVITLAYFSLPFFLVALVRRRGDIEHSWMLWLFALFILLCGLTHLVNIWVMWSPDYGLQGLVKVATALASILTAIAAWPLLPRLLEIPNPTAMRRANERLAMEVVEREAAQAALAERNAELAAVNQDLEDFAYFASHDLKAPLRGVRNLAEWIGEDIGEGAGEDTRRHIALMDRRIERMQALLDGLLDYSRAGRGAVAVETVDVETITRDQFSLLDGDERFELDCDLVGLVLETPAVPLEQVLRNLLSNAIKHHDRDEGRISVRAEEHEAAVDLLVSDDGPGIAPEDRDRVFAMFQTLRPRDDVEGSGLGLAIVRKIAERGGGSVRIEPAERGARGTTFRIRWPRRWSGKQSPVALRAAEAPRPTFVPSARPSPA